MELLFLRRVKPAVGVQPAGSGSKELEGRIFEEMVHVKSREHQRGACRLRCPSVIMFL